jgi:hypothetical protein
MQIQGVKCAAVTYVTNAINRQVIYKSNAAIDCQRVDKSHDSWKPHWKSHRGRSANVRLKLVETSRSIMHDDE